TEKARSQRDRVQRQRNSAIWILPLCSFEASAAVLPNDRQWRSATVCAAAISASSAYQRKVIASGDRLTVQGGVLQAATPSTTTATRTVGKNIDIGTSLRRSSLRPGEVLPIDGLAQLQPPPGFRHRVFEPAGAVEEDDPLVEADLAVS